MRPAILLFPVVTGEQNSALTEIRPAEGLSRLIRACPWAGGYDATDGRGFLRVLGQLARQVRSYQLIAGTDLLDCPGRATELLAPLLER